MHKDSITILAGNGTFNTSGTIIGPVTSDVLFVDASGDKWSNNVSWTWTCQICGTLVVNGSWHVCNQATLQLPQSKPHCCPVCEGRGRVLFDPENPFHRGSSVQDWPCKPCNATGIVWGH